VADEPVVVSKARPMTEILLLKYLHFHQPWWSKPVMVWRGKPSRLSALCLIGSI